MYSPQIFYFALLNWGIEKRKKASCIGIRTKNSSDNVSRAHSTPADSTTLLTEILSHLLICTSFISLIHTKAD